MAQEGCVEVMTVYALVMFWSLMSIYPWILGNTGRLFQSALSLGMKTINNQQTFPTVVS